MSDPLSVLSGIAGLVALAWTIVSNCYSYGCAVQDKPIKFKKLVDEIMSLAGGLAAVKVPVKQTTGQMSGRDASAKDSRANDLPPHKRCREAKISLYI